jgi:hypothetical protein
MGVRVSYREQRQKQDYWQKYEVQEGDYGYSYRLLRPVLAQHHSLAIGAYDNWPRYGYG